MALGNASEPGSSTGIVMATSMKIALALLALLLCAGCSQYYDRYGDGYYSGPRRYYVVSERYKPRYYDDDERRRYDDDRRDRRRYDEDRRDRRRYDEDRRDRRLSDRYDNRDCHETRDGRVKCYDE
jgi:hypothetical protein